MEAMRKKLAPILMLVNWAGISRDYFGKSRSWLHHKMSQTDVNGNGKPADFTEEERLKLKKSLIDLSDRIRDVAEKI